jgi:hypothetical protein
MTQMDYFHYLWCRGCGVASTTVFSLLIYPLKAYLSSAVFHQ